MSYDLRGSTEGEKPLEKAPNRKDVILILAQTSLLCFFSRDFIMFYIFSTFLKISSPHEEEKHYIFLQIGIWTGKLSNVHDSEKDGKSL